MKYYIRFLSTFLILFSYYITYAQCSVKADFTPANDTTISSGIIYFKSTSINAKKYEWSYEFSYPAGTDSVFTFYNSGPGVYTMRLIAKNGACSDTAYRKVIVTGTDKPGINYNAFYGQEGTVETPRIIIPTKDSGFLIGAVMSNTFQSAYFKDLYFIRINSEGCVLWSSRFSGGSALVYADKDVFKGIELTDGSFVITGVLANYTTSNLVIKLSNKGDLLWQKRYEHDKVNATYTDLKEAGNGILLSGSGAKGDSSVALLSRLDLQGKIEWTKIFYSAINQNASKLVLIDGYAYSCSFVSLNNIFGSGDAIITKTDKLSGKTIWTKKYFNGNDSNTTVFCYNLVATPDKKILLSFGDHKGLGYCYIDTTGAVKAGYTAKWDIPIASWGLYKALPMQNGDVVFSLTGTETLPLQPYYSNHSVAARIDSNGKQKWIIDYRPYSRAIMSDFDLASNESMAGVCGEYGRVENYTGFDYNMKLIKIGADGNTTICALVHGYNIDVSQHTISVQNYSWAGEDTIAMHSTVTTLKATGDIASFMYDCPAYYKGCSSLRIEGVNKLCNLYKTYSYKALRASGCTGKINFQTDPSAIKIVASTDTTIEVRFLKPGQQKINVSLNGNCSVLRDSISVTVQQAGRNDFSLGNDFALCPGASGKISAGKNYSAYHWQDGSSDSFFIVKDSGYYFVSVTDSCGYDYADTIHVTLKTTIPVNIGADRQICSGDTLLIEAPPGFINYNWSPSYNLLKSDSTHIAVFPLTDTSYSVTLQNTEGCTGTDTVNIHINYPMPFSLGPDTAFCAGTTLTLQAPAGFNNYTWNDGSSGMVYNVTGTGQYHLKAKDSNGCLSADSINVTVNATPVISLGADRNICQDQSVTLQLTEPVPGIALFKWQDGSMETSFTTNTLGTYSVQVWNNFLCSSTDTIQLLNYDPLPGNFLMPSDSLCEHESMNITTPGSWVTYKWNTGAITPGITITAPGIYTLQVTDANGCAGADTTQIFSKQCLYGIFFPSGFTPNNDGKNDLFKPVVKLALQKYHFVVYNRFGQIIFESTDPQKGWNGYVHGNPQPANSVYPWYCQYQLPGQPLQTAKGTVLLLR